MDWSKSTVPMYFLTLFHELGFLTLDYEESHNYKMTFTEEISLSNFLKLFMDEKNQITTWFDQLDKIKLKKIHLDSSNEKNSHMEIFFNFVCCLEMNVNKKDVNLNLESIKIQFSSTGEKVKQKRRKSLLENFSNLFVDSFGELKYQFENAQFYGKLNHGEYQIPSKINFKPEKDAKIFFFMDSIQDQIVFKSSSILEIFDFWGILPTGVIPKFSGLQKKNEFEYQIQCFHSPGPRVNVGWTLQKRTSIEDPIGILYKKDLKIERIQFFFFNDSEDPWLPNMIQIKNNQTTITLSNEGQIDENGVLENSYGSISDPQLKMDPNFFPNFFSNSTGSINYSTTFDEDFNIKGYSEIGSFNLKLTPNITLEKNSFEFHFQIQFKEIHSSNAYLNIHFPIDNLAKNYVKKSDLDSISFSKMVDTFPIPFKADKDDVFKFDSVKVESFYLVFDGFIMKNYKKKTEKQIPVIFKIPFQEKESAELIIEGAVFGFHNLGQKILLIQNQDTFFNFK
jgi:hypothetical protein